MNDAPRPAWGHPKDNAPLPQTLEDMEDRRLDVLAEMAAIRNQLSQRRSEIAQEAAAGNQANRFGTPRIDHKRWADYNTWRSKAAAALRHFEVELIELKAAIKEERVARGVTGASAKHLPRELDTTNPVHLLAALHGTARRFASRVGYANVDAKDQAILDAVQNALTRRL